MAYTLITPLKVSDMSTNAGRMKTSAQAVKMTTGGNNILCGGSSRIDPTRLLFFISRNSSKCTTADIVSVISGSTAGNSDYFPGGYSTVNNLNITVSPSSGVHAVGVSGRKCVHFFFIKDAAKFLDTDDYLKLKGGAKLTSAAAVAASLGARIGAIYLKEGGH
jgi:hypothetical protein